MCTNYTAESHTGPIHGSPLQLPHILGGAERLRSASVVGGHLLQRLYQWASL